MTNAETTDAESAAARIDQTIAELGDWRGETLKALIGAAVGLNTARAQQKDKAKK